MSNFEFDIPEACRGLGDPDKTQHMHVHPYDPITQETMEELDSTIGYINFSFGILDHTKGYALSMGHTGESHISVFRYDYWKLTKEIAVDFTNSCGDKAFIRADSDAVPNSSPHQAAARMRLISITGHEEVIDHLPDEMLVHICDIIKQRSDELRFSRVGAAPQPTPPEPRRSFFSRFFGVIPR